jgi:hypothetical protein
VRFIDVDTLIGLDDGRSLRLHEAGGDQATWNLCAPGTPPASIDVPAALALTDPTNRAGFVQASCRAAVRSGSRAPASFLPEHLLLLTGPVLRGNATRWLEVHPDLDDGLV